MSNEKVFYIELRTVYPLLVAKAEKKGRTRAEVDQAACWLTGYSPEELASLLKSSITYGDFFRQAPAPQPPAPADHRCCMRRAGGNHFRPIDAGNPLFRQAGR